MFSEFLSKWFSEAAKMDMKWHRDCLKEDLRGMAAERIKQCAQMLEDGVPEGVFVMQPPTDEEHENYYLAKLNVFFELWAKTWSR